MERLDIICRQLLPTTRILLMLAVCLSAALTPAAFAETSKAVPVLLTFDTEDDQDVLAIREMQITEPSTYYLTGQFVERHGKLVAELAARHTIGAHSYSHAHLTQIEPVDLRKELLSTQMLLKEKTGTAPRWFRAPYLEFNPQVMEVLKELGFNYDSSDQERWTKQTVLLTTPISNRDGSDQLVSDYDMFMREEMTNADALQWLKDRYRERMPTGRPLVFLMHPRIIGAHKQVLFDFIDFVREQGGVFLSSDQWMERVTARQPRKLGTWIDLSLGSHDAEQLAEDIRTANITDVYLMARDPEGNDYFVPKGKTVDDREDVFGKLVDTIRMAGVRVHAWLPAFRNPYLAQLEPRMAMVGDNGAASLEWLSPFHPEVQQHLLDTATWLLRNYDLHGIHLDYLRYPGLGFDYSTQALDGFAKANSLEDVTPAIARSDYYRAWIDWRAEQIAEFTGKMQKIVRLFGAQDAELSAALIADAALSHRSQEQFGQDYARLAEHLDVVMPMAYFKEERKPPEWIAQILAAARYRVGDTRIYTGLAAYQKPGEWNLSTPQLEGSIRQAIPGSDGIVFYPYLHLFSRGANDWDMPNGSAKALALVSDGIKPAQALPPSNRTSEKSKDQSGTTTALPHAPGQTAGSTGPPYLVALTSALLGGSAVWMLSYLRRQTAVTGAFSSPVESTGPAEAVDWKALEQPLAESTVSAETYAAVSSVLHFIGATKISAYRGARVLDVLRQAPMSIGQILAEMAGQQEPDPKHLRYIEECILLDYVRLNHGLCEITPAGIERLEHCEKLGFSGNLLAFIEQRLAEKLVVTCPFCGGKTVAHWFWRDLQCPACGSSFDIVQASHIEVHKPLYLEKHRNPNRREQEKISRLHTLPGTSSDSPDEQGGIFAS